MNLKKKLQRLRQLDGDIIQGFAKIMWQPEDYSEHRKLQDDIKKQLDELVVAMTHENIINSSAVAWYNIEILKYKETEKLTEIFKHLQKEKKAATYLAAKGL